MAIKRIPVGAFVAFLVERWKAKDGYIMGATGQDPSKWSTGSWWITQYSGAQRDKALYWRAHAQRVWDCAGLAEGYYKDMTGVDVNQRARNIYAEWCSVKGTGKVPTQQRVPGLAVFIHSTKEGAITHVGYLVEPVKAGDPAGDWYVIEARGVMYGVVRTKLSERGWNRWGIMDKYFDYDADIVPPKFGDRELRVGCVGADVRELQEMLIRLGYDCGRWGADGEFGADTENAVKVYQLMCGLDVDGVVGEKTLAELLHDGEVPDNAEPDEGVEVVPEGDLTVKPGTWNVRMGPGIEFDVAQIANGGDKLRSVVVDGWVPINVGGEVKWISRKAVQ